MMENFDITPEAKSTTVLVVDDMAANRSVLCRQLEMHDYAVISVESGEEALELLAQAQPDIVLLDYMMPRMNGIEVLHELRKNPQTADLPVIMVTARAESEATVKALEAGADDYVVKPIDFGVLRARIESHLAKQGDTTELRRCNAVLDERMTMRSLVLADMETELRDEIGRREELEAKLLDGPSDTTPIAATPKSNSASAARLEPDAVEKLAAIKTKFGLVFDSVIAGRTPNLAQMHELNGLLAALVDEQAKGSNE